MAGMDAPRYLCSQLVSLSWGSQSTTVNLEEIQADGGVVECEVELVPDTQVEIRSGAVLLAGRVSGTEEHQFGWRIAVEFSPLTPWSLEHFRPEHLFDPAAMLGSKTAAT